MYKEQGFTLLEMLVALTLLALLLTVTFTSFVTLNQSAQRVEAISVDNHRFVSMSRFVMDKLASAQPAGWLSEGSNVLNSNESDLFLEGSDRELTWLGVMSPTQNLGGVHFMRLMLKDQQTLVFQWLPFDDLTPDWSRAQEYLLITGLSMLNIEYFDASTSEWTNEWGANQGLPRLIRVSITEDDLSWPDLSVQLMHWTTG